MNFFSRISSLERKQKQPIFSPERQAFLVEGFLGVFELINDRPPTDAELQKEQERLSQQRLANPRELKKSINEVEEIVLNEKT